MQEKKIPSFWLSPQAVIPYILAPPPPQPPPPFWNEKGTGAEMSQLLANFFPLSLLIIRPGFGFLPSKAANDSSGL